MPVDVGITVKYVGRLVDAVTAGAGAGIVGVLPTREGCGEGFAEAEDAFEDFVGGVEGIEGKLQTVEADDCAAVAFDDGRHAVPIGAAEVAADDEAFGFDALHGRYKDNGCKHG